MRACVFRKRNAANVERDYFPVTNAFFRVHPNLFVICPRVVGRKDEGSHITTKDPIHVQVEKEILNRMGGKRTKMREPKIPIAGMVFEFLWVSTDVNVSESKSAKVETKMCCCQGI